MAPTSRLDPAESGEPPLREGLPEHGAVLEEPALVGCQAVEAGRDQRVERLRHVERHDLARGGVDRASWTRTPRSSSIRTVSTAYSGTPSARSRICAAQAGRQAGDEPVEQLAHRLLRERVEVDAGEVALPCAPRRPPLDQLGPGESDHVERMVARPVEQVLDEVEQARVRPLHVLEREHGGVDLGEPLEEQPPRREQVLPVGDPASARPRSCASRGSTKARSSGS